MTSMIILAKMADVEDVEVVVAHNERATLRVGDVFLKIDADQTRTDVEVEAMAMAPIPTPEVLWRKRLKLALAGRVRLPGWKPPAAVSVRRLPVAVGPGRGNGTPPCTGTPWDCPSLQVVVGARPPAVSSRWTR